MNHNLKSGFTLIELLVVVLIIGILSAVALPQYEKAVKKARGVQVTTAAETLVKAANLAYLEDGTYASKRIYYFYSELGVDSSYSGEKFDIDIPKVTIFKDGLFWLGMFQYSDSNTATITTSFVKGFPSGWDSRFYLKYVLERGAVKSVTCSGPDCKIYFPQYQ